MSPTSPIKDPAIAITLTLVLKHNYITFLDATEIVILSSNLMVDIRFIYIYIFFKFYYRKISGFLHNCQNIRAFSCAVLNWVNNKVQY